MDNNNVPSLYWLSYNALKLKNIIDKPNVPYDIRLFKKNIKKGLIGAIKKKDYNLINYHLWRRKKIKFKPKPWKHNYDLDLNLILAAIKLGDLDFIKYLINKNYTYKSIFNIFTKKIINATDLYNFEVIIKKVSQFITLEIFKYLYEIIITNLELQLPQFIFIFTNSNIIKLFILNNRIDIIEYMFHNRDHPIDDYYSYFRIACIHGVLDVAKYIYGEYNLNLPQHIIQDIIRTFDTERGKQFHEVRIFLLNLPIF